jgi:N-acetylglucosamine-6-phosphate deacetylase
MFKGWIDLQVNGYKGIDFSAPNLTVDDVLQVSKLLLENGTIGYCPTVITSPMSIYEQNLKTIAKAATFDKGAKILGIHVEGPFINPKEGARGVHPRNSIILPDEKIILEMMKWADNKISILTLAPEMEGAIDLIENLHKETSIVLSMGHSLADKQTISKAADVGLKCATHIANGLPSMIQRHYNPIWPMLAEDRLTGFFITDGFHLPKDLIKVCLRAKKVSNFIVTSDVAHIAGLSPGNYEFHGTKVVLEANKHLHVKGSLQLAGAGSLMQDCMNVMAGLNELSLEELQKIGFYNALEQIEVHESLFDNIKIPKLDYIDKKFSFSSA